ncbi:hypothetical protein KCU67_g13190, partial [Aureobasidium melanogenum]
MQELEIKCLLKNDASDFGWKIVADERNEVIKDQKQDIVNMKHTIDAARELQVDHQKLQESYSSLQRNHYLLQQDHAKLRRENKKSDKKIKDLEARIDTKSQECFEANHARQDTSNLTMGISSERTRSWFHHNFAFASDGPKRTLDNALVHLSNRLDLPSVVIAYLRKEFFLTGSSLGRVNDARFNEAVIGWACGTICVQQKVYNSAYTVPEDRSGACEICVR